MTVRNVTMNISLQDDRTLSFECLGCGMVYSGGTLFRLIMKVVNHTCKRKKA